MAVVHETPAGERATLATTVETAETTLQQARGLTFRRSIPADYALVFPFDRATRRSIHTVFVPFAIDVCWLVEDTVERVTTMPAWRGFGMAIADTIVEFPAGTADGVAVGDAMYVEE
jgi:uncharacterized membrane protein (UPF0127 family)